MFHFYMYAVGIIFLLYVNFLVIHPWLWNKLMMFLADKGYYKRAEVDNFQNHKYKSLFSETYSSSRSSR